jgi:hypothetical protein
MINRIHKAIRLLVNQNGVQDFTPEEIDIAFNNASTNLFKKLLTTYRETNKLPDWLQVFKRRGTGTVSSDKVAISSFVNLAEVLGVSVIVSGEEFPAELVRNDADWLRRSLRDLIPDKDNPDNPLHLYEVQKVYASADFTNRLALLPPYFLQPESVSIVLSGGAKYPYDVLTSKEYDQRSMARLIRNKDLPKDELFRFLVRKEYLHSDFTNNKAALPDNFVAAEDFATLISGTNEYQWRKGSPEEWSSESLALKIKSGEIGEDELYKYLDRVEFDVSDFTDGKAALPENTVMLGDFATLKTATHEYQWRKSSPGEWDAKTIAAKIKSGELPEDELAWYEARIEYADTAFTNNKLTLPDNFVAAKKRSVYIDANGKEYDWRLADSEDWSGKSLIEKLEKGQLPQDEIHWYEQTNTYTGNEITAGKIDVPANFVQLVSVNTIVNGKRYEGNVVSNEDWDKRQANSVTEKDGESRPLNQIKAYEDISLSSSFGNLPDDFNEEIAVAVRDPRGNETQVKIVSIDQFNDLLDDQVTPATTEYRVCTFIDDKIRVFPGNDLELIRLYYYQKPNEKNIQIRVVGGRYEIYPKSLSNGVQVEVLCRVFPPKERSLYRINGNQLELKSNLATREKFVFDCYVCPTSARGLFWAYNETLEVKPALQAGEKLIVPIIKWPTSRHGMFWEYENTIEVKPALQAGEKLIVPMYEYPNKYRGQSRVYGPNIEVNPPPVVGESIAMNYIAAITERAARVRIDNNGINFLPASLTNSVAVYWLTRPLEALWGYTISGNNFIYAETGGVNADTIEPGWGQTSYYELLKGTIAELNIPIKDTFVLQQMGLMERSDLEQQTIDLKGYGKGNA